MADTTFIDKETRIEASWCQDMNDFKYQIFDGAVTKQGAALAIGAIRVEGVPTDGQVPSWDADASAWVPATVSGGGGVTNPLVIEGTLPSIILTNTGTDQGPGLRLEYSIPDDTTYLRLYNFVKVGGVWQTDGQGATFQFAMSGTFKGRATAFEPDANWVVDPTNV